MFVQQHDAVADVQREIRIIHRALQIQRAGTAQSEFPSGSVFADYYSATVDDKGWLKEGHSADGLHPNEKGYALMVPVANAAIEQALR